MDLKIIAKKIIEEALLLEGINDKNKFKAVFLAGGPGSGKSFIGEKMFKSTGAKVISSDKQFEFLLKKNNLPIIMSKEGSDKHNKQMEIRGDAKGLTTGIAGNWMNGMLPIIMVQMMLKNILHI